MNVVALPILLSGFTTQAGIIIAVGAQNAFIIRQGVARSHILPIIVICIAADMMLISLGTQGMGQIVTSHTAVLTALTWLGALVLALYGVMAFRRVYRRVRTLRQSADGSTVAQGTTSSSADTAGTTTPAAENSLKSVVMQCLGFTFLNPGVYLDTIVLLGGIATTYGAHLKWSFATGAMLCSIVWFILLGLMSSKMSRLFRSDYAWIILDSIIGVTMILLACHMVLR